MKQPLPPTSGAAVASSLIRKARISPYLFTFLAFVIFVAILYGEDFSCTLRQKQEQPLPKAFDISSSIHQQREQQPIDISTAIHQKRRKSSSETSRVKNNDYDRKKGAKKLAFTIGKKPKGCDYFSGTWVRDETNRPLYKESQCPYIQPQLTCLEHGRPERGHQYWRWQPSGCDLPEFNATLMLEALRNKRLLFVGDSLNRGQYVSLVCLLQSVIPEGAKSMESSYDSLTVFRAKDYNATLEFYWAPFLMESNSDNAVIHRVNERIVRKGSIKTHGKYWKGADVVVFNTYLWWMTGQKMKIMKGSFKDEVKEIEELSTEDAYRMAMKSMLHWVQRNMDVKKYRVFFTSMSPTHGKAVDWGGEPNDNCFNETTLIEDPTYWGSDSRKSVMKVMAEEFGKSKVPVSFLNITQMSSYRKDAHTSIYKKQWNPLTPEQLANPASYADCVHWCLPGLQDVWNELLYAKLFFP